ncbi:MAG: acyl carrier protein [Actinomadura rubrobrunea]|nr:acyl carrier protein [Actinomadura rubrobrunea]
MLEDRDVSAVVTGEIRELLQEFSPDEVSINGHDQLTDLGFNSLTLARLIIALESELGVDPFASDVATVAELRTVDDVIAVYRRALTITAAGGTAG